ncbi:MAG: hypothetical protein M3547_01360, partial [Acidobacteriota bacterium]|nr:hypothetical protein [Acidobacteriota bacterium]
NAEYMAERRKIEDEEIAARRAAEKEIAQINKDAAEDLGKVAKAFKDKSQVVREELAKEGSSLTDAVAQHAVYIAGLDGIIKKVNELGEAPGKAAAAFVAGADTIEAALERIRAMAVKVDMATTSAFRTGHTASAPTPPLSTSPGAAPGAWLP